MSYSLQLHTLRNAIQEDLPGTIKKVAEIGFTQVEPYNFVATVRELGAALKENGLTAPSGHYDPEAIFGVLGERGHIALEVHDNDAMFSEARWGKGAQCRWRNIRIKELTKEANT